MNGVGLAVLPTDDTPGYGSMCSSSTGADRFVRPLVVRSGPAVRQSLYGYV